jgi:membrane protease YdiL (CAAX protease family)
MTKWGNVISGFLLVLLGILFDYGIQLSAANTQAMVAGIFHTSVNSWLAITAQLVVVVAFTLLAAAAMLWLIHRVNPKVGFHAFDRQKLHWIWRGYLLILGAGMLVNVLRMVAEGGLKTAANQQALQSLAKSGLGGLVFVIILAVFVAPILEELIFRGVILNYMFKDGPWWLNVVISGFLFGYFHVFQAFNWFDLLQYSLMGVVLAVVYKQTKQLQYSMLLHFVNNSVAVLALVAGYLAR